jgi:hypothetical protein
VVFRDHRRGDLCSPLTVSELMRNLPQNVTTSVLTVLLTWVGVMAFGYLASETIARVLGVTS